MKLIARIVTIVTFCFGALGAPAQAATPNVRTLTLGGKHCDLIAVPMSKPVAGTGSCPGVRPGALVQTSLGSCTLNFLFVGSDGARYIGTAGHCILGGDPSNPAPVQMAKDAGEKSWAIGKGPVARDANNKVIGRFVYAVLQDPKDFALIRLSRGVASSPNMCVFGAPSGINTSTTGPVVLHHFGNGIGIGNVLPARTEVAQDMSSPDHVFANGVIAPGDSGSGVIDDAGKAVGVVVTLGAHIGGANTDAGLIGITRLAPQLARASRVLRLKLRLLTG